MAANVQDDLEEKSVLLAEVERTKEQGDEVPAPPEPPSPAARTLATDLVVLAPAEALTQLGEGDQGTAMVAEWMRESLPA